MEFRNLNGFQSWNNSDAAAKEENKIFDGMFITEVSPLSLALWIQEMLGGLFSFLYA